MSRWGDLFATLSGYVDTDDTVDTEALTRGEEFSLSTVSSVSTVRDRSKPGSGPACSGIPRPNFELSRPAPDWRDL